MGGCAKSRAPEGAFVPVPSLSSPIASDGAALEWAILPGGTSVVAVDAKDLGDFRGNELRLDDGIGLKIHPYVLKVKQGPAERAADPTSVAARAQWWLGLGQGGRLQEWSAEAAAAPFPQTTTGATVLLVEAPRQPNRGGPATSAGSLGARRVEVKWLVASEGAPDAAAVFRRPIPETTMESAWMRAALAAGAGSPLTRWRARLAAGTLVRSAGDGGPVEGFSDPVIEALARTIEAQWVSGLGTLAAADAGLARRVVERLCACVDAGGGVFVPAWTPEGEALTALLDSLLDPRPRKAADAAAAWLAESSAVRCWVVDDAGSVDPVSGQPAGSVGVANLTGAPLAAWAEQAGGAGVPEIVAVPPWSTRQFAALGADPLATQAKRPAGIAADAALRGQRVTVRAGEQSFGPTLYSARAPALAPGVVIGPLHPDWRLAGWLAAGADDDYSKRLGPWSGASLADPSWTTTGQIYRGVDAPLAGGETPPDRWLLYVELQAPVGRDGNAIDLPGSTGLLRVWFGPFGRSTVVLRVLPDGRVIDETAPGLGAGRDVPHVARVARSDHGWNCWLPLPVSAIEKDGTLRIGVERVDGRGVRTSWPRPSLPWQQEPSRIAIDTTIWGERVSPE
jgi:hypothetical protein